MSTRYQTRLTADIEMSAPSMPVKPQIKTVKCRIKRFLFSPADVFFGYIIWVLFAANITQLIRIFR